MLGSLRITGFRAFSDLVVERLGRVTLVVGKNNVGKTTLLEAVHLHASGAAALVAAHGMLERREEFQPHDLDDDVDLERLFFAVDGTAASIFTISAADGSDWLKVTTTWSWTEKGDDQSTRRVMGDTPPLCQGGFGSALHDPRRRLAADLRYRRAPRRSGRRHDP